MILDTRIHDLLSRWEAADVKPTPEELCSGQPELIDEVRDRIDRLRTIDRRLHEESEPDAPTPPDIPGYTTGEMIGHGGMGTVWRATQLGTHRAVALKVVNAGAFASPRARARFEREVELSSRLNHPNIARVYDSGVNLGRLYYAMELIDGVALDRFVESANLSQSQILQLMQTVCAAVHHAHQFGVIHRDLKPSNILVDQNGQPHVLDFGVAKQIVEGDAAQLTLENDAPGTPAYMSPEQAAGQTRTVGTASDVYTLGVILYQLLLSRLPHDVKGTSIEVMHRITMTEPARPRDVSATIEADLEAILVKTLSREPADRYASADELGRDLGRFLARLPVIARRQTLLYVTWKRLARHKWKVLATAAVLVLMASFAGWSFVNIQRQRARADLQARHVIAVNDFLLDRLLAANDPAVAKGSNPTLRDLLDRAAAEAGTAFRDQPLIEAQLRTTIGKAYSNLAQRGVAPQQFHRVIEIYQEQFCADDPRTLHAEAEYAFALESDHRFVEAEAAQRSLYARTRRGLGERHPDTLMCLHRLANIAAECGHFETAEPLFRQSLAARLEVLGPDHPDTLWSLSDLGGTLSALGRPAEAEPLLREALGRRLRVLGPDTLDTLNAELNLAFAIAKQHRYADAEPIFLHNLESRRRVLGKTHTDVSIPTMALAEIRMRQERFNEAATLAHEAFELRYNNDQFTTAGTMFALTLEVQARVAAGDTKTARLQLQDAIDAVEQSRKAGGYRSFPGIRGYIAALRALGDDAEADDIERSLNADAK